MAEPENPDEKPGYGFFNRDPRRADRFDNWTHGEGTTTVTAELAKDGWRPMSEVPKNRYVALYFRDSVGEFEGSAAYYLENNRWHVAKSKMVFDARCAIAWRRWTKDELEAQPLPPKDRRG